jgi:hypothetical protein
MSNLTRSGSVILSYTLLVHLISTFALNVCNERSVVHAEAHWPWKAQISTRSLDLRVKDQSKTSMIVYCLSCLDSGGGISSTRRARELMRDDSSQALAKTTTKPNPPLYLITTT